MIPVAARYKMLVCSRSLAGISGSNPAGAMYVCLPASCECNVCCQVKVSPTGRSLAQRIPMKCGVSECNHKT